MSTNYTATRQNQPDEGTMENGLLTERKLSPQWGDNWPRNSVMASAARICGT
jgi:hypothetical protein